MSKSDIEKTEELINKLCNDLEPTSPRCPYRRVSVWLMLSLVYLGVVVQYVGLRMDIADKFSEPIFFFEFGMITALLLTSSLASSWLSFPDCIQRDWMKIVPLTLFATFILWIVSQMIGEQGRGFQDVLHIGHCAKEGLFMEAVPIIALIVITMKGHTTQPYWSMAMNVLAVSALGWLGLRLTCSMSDMGHMLVNHILPFAIVSGALALFARKLFKW